MPKPSLTQSRLIQASREFALTESQHHEARIFGATDGKAVGTYVEHKLRSYLAERYDFASGSSAKGIDFPELEVDLKVTSIKQPQSSCPLKNASQKIYGLGYSLLVFVYNKIDNVRTKTSQLDFKHTLFVEKERTGDFQTTTGLQTILANDGNKDDIIAFLHERMLPVEDISANSLAEEIMKNPPKTGYLTLSNALQWRLQYSRVILKAGEVERIKKIV